MASNEVQLEKLEVFVRNSDLGESAKACVDAINRLSRFENVFNNFAAGADLFIDAWSESDRLKIVGSGCQLSQSERTCTDEDHSRL